jgi:hypothetical protein
VPHHQLLTVLLSQHLHLQLHRLLPLLPKLLQPQPHPLSLQLVTSPLLLQLLVTPLILVPLQLLALVVHQQLSSLHQPLHQLPALLPWRTLLLTHQQLETAQSLQQLHLHHQQQQGQQNQVFGLLL